jgi:5-formyltetrahydrofolate cyclo-ligase
LESHGFGPKFESIALCYTKAMNEVQELIRGLRRQGWTYRAIAEELGFHMTSVQQWAAGTYIPLNPKLVLEKMRSLLNNHLIPA